MKFKISYIYITVIILLCISMLTACGDMGININISPKDDGPSSSIEKEVGSVLSDLKDKLTSQEDGGDQGGENEEKTPEGSNQSKKNVKDSFAKKSQGSEIPVETKLVHQMNDDELSDYFLSQVPEAESLVKEHGMAVLVTEETTVMDDGYACIDIWLGTNLDDKFTKEILYAIHPYGLIYEYDVIEDYWGLVSMGSITRLAEIKLGEVIDDETAEMLVDGVTWISGENEPNGYRIENEKEEWVPYRVTLWTDYNVWGFVEDVGMENFKINFDNFLFELTENRGDGTMLADIATVEGDIVYIAERYTP